MLHLIANNLHNAETTKLGRLHSQLSMSPDFPRVLDSLGRDNFLFSAQAASTQPFLVLYLGSKDG